MAGGAVRPSWGNARERCPVGVEGSRWQTSALGLDPVPCLVEGPTSTPISALLLLLAPLSSLLLPGGPVVPSPEPSPPPFLRQFLPIGVCWVLVLRAVCLHPEGVLPPAALCPSATSAGLEGSPASAPSPVDPILCRHLPRVHPLSPTLGWGQKQRDLHAWADPMDTSVGLRFRKSRARRAAQSSWWVLG